MEDNYTGDAMPDVGFDAPDDAVNLMPFTNRYYPVDPHTQYAQYVMMAMVGANVLGLGGQVQGEIMLRLIQNPLAISMGMFCRLALLPAVSAT